MNVSELSGSELDRQVARARGIDLVTDTDGTLLYYPGHNLPARKWAPSHFWSQGGPLIEEAHIDLNWDTEGNSLWSASLEPDILAQGSSVLEAAMRAYVLLKLG